MDRALAVDPECNFASLIRAGLHHAIDSPRVRMSAENTLLGLIGGDAEADAAASSRPDGGSSAAGAPTSGVPRQHGPATAADPDASTTPVPPQRAAKNRRLAKS